MVLFLIFALVALVILMWLDLFSKKENNTIEFVLHCFAIISVFCAFVVYGGSPQAIDVYRGKTTLEITYKDSIPVDSIVVFKTKTK